MLNIVRYYQHVKGVRHDLQKLGLVTFLSQTQAQILLDNQVLPETYLVRPYIFVPKQIPMLCHA